MTFSSPTVIKTTVSGEAYEKWTTATNPSSAGQHRDTIYAEGRQYNGNCFASFELQWGQTFVGYCNSPPPPGGVKWTRVSGTGKLEWNRKGDTTCGQQAEPCYRYDGEFRMRIDRPSATLSLHADRWAVPKNTLVNFYATVTPDGFGGPPLGKLLTPFKVQRWEYRPDRVPRQGQTVADTAWRWVCVTPADVNPAKCPYSVDSSGTLRIQVDVQGERVVQSVHVRVFCVPTGDVRLDSLPVLDVIDSARRLGNFFNPNPALRREVSWTVDCDPGGECRMTFYVGTVCTSPTVPVGVPGMRRAEGHIHVLRPLGLSFGTPDSVPAAVCPGRGGRTTGWAFGNPAPSPDDDLVILTSPSRQTPHYMAEPDLLYRIPVAQQGWTNADLFINTDPFARVDPNGCSRY